MEYSLFTSHLGDFLIGYQTLLDNLGRLLNRKVASLEDGKEVFSKLKESETKDYVALMDDVDFFFNRVASTFIDLDQFEESAPFEAACERLSGARKRLCAVNVSILRLTR